MHKIKVLSRFSAVEEDYIRKHKDLVWVAETWKDYKAADPEFAFDDVG